MEKQLGPEYISTRPGAGGGKVHYLAAEKVINLANEVFGFNGWSSSIQNVQIDFVDENPQNGKITLGLSTIVRVTLRDGTFHEDIGYGHIENCKGKAAAFEKAKKEAATDSLKRALRNFGNVLGNCLYDKDYLQKVTKLKIAPSKWDADNLHRHADYAPIKRESIADAEHRDEVTRRQSSAQSATSFGSGEFEDDFGGNLFDETDFNHPDEIRLDDTKLESPAHRAVHGPQQGGQRHGVSRMHSMPQLRPPNVQPPQPIQGVEQLPKPSGLQRPPNNAGQAQPHRMLPPQQQGVQRRPPQSIAQRAQPAQAQPVQQRQQVPSGLQQQTNSDGSRSNPSSAGTVDDSAANPVNLPNGDAVQNVDGQQMDENGLPLPRPPPAGHPEGFVTGRSVDLLSRPPDSRPPNASLAFNPHADSPSIRRTHGVNPGKSAPVSRQLLNGGPSNGQPANTAAPSPGPGNGMNGATTPVRTNYVNPAADVNRRIGAPPGMAGATPNRGAYRPPTMNGAKRPALADVSNLQQLDGAAEAKKPRVETTAVSIAQDEVQKAPNAEAPTPAAT